MKNPYSTLSLVVSILSLSLAGCASTQPKGVDAAQAVGPAAAACKEVLETLEIRAFDLAYQPNAFTVAKPGRYVVKLLNIGQMPHDITFPDGAKISAAAGNHRRGGNRGAARWHWLHLLSARPFPCRHEGRDPGGRQRAGQG